MAGGKIRHWKHGWIPLTPEAKAFLAGKGPNPTGKGRSRPHPVVVSAKDLQRSGQADKMLASIRENGGFTYDPRTAGLLEVGKASGFAIAIPGTETNVGVENVSREDFAQGVAKVIRENRDKIANGAVLGGWYSPDRGVYLVEVSEIFPPNDREGAIRIGKARNQEGIFDLATGETIPTGGTGDGPPPDTVT